MSLEQYDLQDTAKLLTWIFMIFPHFALSHGLGNINMITSFNQICDMQCKLIPGCTKEIMCEILPLFNSSVMCCGKKITITLTEFDGTKFFPIFFLLCIQTTTTLNGMIMA